MKNINMLSRVFSHANCSTEWKVPKQIKWDFFSYANPISVYVDRDVEKGIKDHGNGKKNFLWLLESRYFDGGAANFIKNNLDSVLESFEEIWTYDVELLSLNEKFKWCPAYGTYIKDIFVRNKTKNISMITSNKTMTEQHKFRYNFAIGNKDKFDLFGRGFKEIQEKEEGLNEYMFSVAIENDTYDTYFTEKILDCFATGTIPIFKGTKRIVEHFNPDGILFLDEINLSELNTELYQSKMNSILENCQIVKQYDVLDDWIYNNYLSFYL